MTASKKLIQAAAGSAGGDFYPYTVDNSARFEDGDLPYLYRATSTPDDATRGAISFWVKRGNLSTAVNPISCAGTSITACYFQADNTLNIYDYMNGGGLMQYVTTRVFRDTSAWYHILLIINTNEATALDRVKLYVNGVRETSFSTSTTGSQSASSAWLIAQNCNIGRYASGANLYYDGYMSEVARIDGTVYSPTDFGEDKNGVWVPKNLSALSFGSEGFYMTFGNSGALGTDSSGNGNNFTVSGLTSSDQMNDTPTNNFATLNPLLVTASATNTYSNGNLDATTGTTGGGNVTSTMAVPSSGKWYFEVTVTAVGSGTNIGLWEPDASEDFGYQVTPSIAYLSSAYKRVNNSTTSYGATYTTNDVIGVAVDIGASTVTYYKNNTSQGSISFDASGLFPFMCDNTGGSGASVSFDFGQLGFTYTPPTDHLALCTANLPEPAIGPNSTTTSGENFNTVLWTGDQSARTITGYGFQPDFLWTKCRSTVESHRLHDVVRGGNGTVLYELNSNETSAEGTDTLVSGFATDGFTIAAGGNSPNVSGRTYVGWAWKGNGSGVTNTDGTITSTVSANTDAGISIVTWTGNGVTNATIGHGLGVKPAMIIAKSRSVVGDWRVWHSGLSGAGYYLTLNQTAAQGNSTSVWGTSPAQNTTTFTIGTNSDVNTSSATYLAYCFAEVEGFSKFGSWTGQSGSEFIYTGFRPAFVMVKRTNTSGWYIFDNKRGYNGGINSLQPNTSGADAGPWTTQFNLYSNGFEDGNFVGDAGTTIIYAAFAEMPFKYSNAR